MYRISNLLATAFLLCAIPSHAQNVRQSGNVTPGHAACWAVTGVVYDCGSPGGGVSVVGSTTTNDFVAFNGSGSLIDSGINPANTSNISGLWNFNGGATAPTRSNGDNSTYLATTAFVQNLLGTTPVFTNGIELSGPGPASQLYYPFYLTNSNSCTQGCGGLLVSGVAAGTPVAGQLFFNDFALAHDNVVVAPGAIVSNIYSLDVLDGVAATGNRYSILGVLQQTGVTANKAASTQGQYVGTGGIATTTTGDGGNSGAYWGGYFGGNFFCGNGAAALYIQLCTGAEFDNYGVGGATQFYKFGINIADGNGGAGTSWDTAIAAYVLGASPPYAQGHGWGQILSIGDVNSGLQPLSSGGTILGTHLGALSQINAGHGVDWSYVNFSGFFLKGGCTGAPVVCSSPGSPNFTVDGLGNTVTTSLTGQGSNYLILCATGITSTNCVAGGDTTHSTILVGNNSDLAIYHRASKHVFESAGASGLTLFGDYNVTNSGNWTFNAGIIGTGATFGGLFRLTYGAPTIASGACGATTNGSVSGNNQNGLITIGAAATTTCTVSFSTTLANAPNACVIFPANATAAATGTTVARVSSIGTTNFVVTGSALASSNYYYICI